MANREWAKRSRFALDRAIVRHWSEDNDEAPDSVTRKACFQHDDQPIGIDPQADWSIGK